MFILFCVLIVWNSGSTGCCEFCTPRPGQVERTDPTVLSGGKGVYMYA